MAAENRSRSFVSHAATYAIGNIARRVVGFAMLPIYTRYLTPADYGVVGLLIFALSLLETLFGARLGWAIPKFYFDASDDRGRREVIWGALGLTGAASAVSVIVLAFMRNGVAGILFGNHKYGLALALFSITLLSQPVEQVGMTYLRLRERSGLFLVFSVAKLLVQLILNLLLVVYLDDGVLGVVLSAVISSVLLGAAGAVYVALEEAPAFEWGITRRMMQFSWPLWLSGLGGLYIGTSGAMYVRIFDSLSDVGLLELALRFAATIPMLLWSPFLQHWEPMSFQYYRQPNGKQKFQVAFIAISALMFAGGLGVSVFSAPVIKLMAAKPFYAAASVVPILTYGLVLDRLRSFFDFSFMVTGRTTIRSLYQYGSAAVITVGYVALIPRFGLTGAAVAQCLAFGATFVYVYLLSRRYYDPEIKLSSTGLFSLIGVGAYVLANMLSNVSNLGIDLLIKSLVMLTATTLMAVVALRAVRAIDGSLLQGLPSPLRRLGEMQPSRLWGG